jgi:hypothetical protein
MKNLICILFTLLLLPVYSWSQNGVKVEGELKQWHKVTLVLNGPETSEWAKENPFLDINLKPLLQMEIKVIRFPDFLQPMEMQLKLQPIPEIPG